jgi:hypothetical protein
MFCLDVVPMFCLDVAMREMRFLPTRRDLCVCSVLCVWSGGLSLWFEFGFEFWSESVV